MSDPIETPKAPVSRPPRVLPHVLLVLGMWGSIRFLGPLTGLVIPISMVAGMFFLLADRRFVTALVFLAATPLTIPFVSGVVDYAHGNAELRSSGLLGDKAYNLDPELRCWLSQGGCEVDGHEWVYQAPYNVAVVLLTKTVGYMPGTYTGPYPTVEEATAAVMREPAVPWMPGGMDRIIAAIKSPLLGEEIYISIVNRGHQFRMDVDNLALQMRTVLWQERCLIVWLSPAKPEEYQWRGMIVLVDRESGRAFAAYSLDTTDTVR